MPPEGPILILGRNGQVGRELALTASGDGSVRLIGRGDLDITDEDALRRAVEAAKPAFVVNAAAYTAVDKAESEKDLATAVNADAVAVMADACHAAGAILVHLSTDYVFAGDHQTAWRESDAVAPLNVYGRSKLAGEDAVRRRLEGHVILRTSSVFSPFGRNFVKTMVALRGRAELRIVTDQTSGPTPAADIARAVMAIVDRLRRAPEAESGSLFGTYHFCGQPAVTWFDLAAAVFERLQADGRAVPTLQPTDTARYGAPARRPPYSVLDCAKIRQAFGIKQPDWRSELDRVIGSCDAA